jgi:hypothetical protein
MSANDLAFDVTLLGKPAVGMDGQPTVTLDEAVAVVRYHIALEELQTDLYDRELWQLWRDEVQEAGFWHDNSDVLDQVMSHVRGDA